MGIGGEDAKGGKGRKGRENSLAIELLTSAIADPRIVDPGTADLE